MICSSNIQTLESDFGPEKTVYNLLIILYICGQNLSQTSKETEDFLGAERRLLTEELAETKANFSVKSMELSRVTAELENQKMAYEEAQFAQQQLRWDTEAGIFFFFFF